MSTKDQALFWRAVMSRDSGLDGAFVYAVRSTGVYCRPSCPSRRPRRRQVVFFLLPEAAERAGFRPCRRCQPWRAGASPQAEIVRLLCGHIAKNLEDPLTLKTLGAKAGKSLHHVQRMFKRLVGVTPRQYVDACRLDRVKAALRDGKPVTAALYEAGYGSSSRLYERAAPQLGMTPATYRRGGRGMALGYTVVSSPLGRLLVAASERGIAAVSLGDSDGALEAALRQEYPHAKIHRDQNGLRPWVSAVLEHLRGQRPDLNLPLDVQATAFQRRVWDELRSIPYGSTRSYKQIARSIGRPKAVRAVGRACATNPVSLVIPCHRAVPEGGGLAGYRWGLERKRALLAQERKALGRRL